MSRKKTHEEYVKELAEKNPNVEVCEEYKGSNIKIMHHCLLHDVYWLITPIGALNGNGCEKCRKEKFHKKYVKSTKQYVNELKKINKNLEVIGEYIDAKQAIYNSYYIIKSISIPGISSRDIFLTACVVYNMNSILSHDESIEGNYLSPEELLIINKLSCILRMAVSFDASKTGLIEDIEIVQTDNMIIINAKALKEPFVELFTFEKVKHTFEETFGIQVDIRTKMIYD